MNILKSLFLIIPLVFCANVVGAQELHMPHEVEQYMKKSSIQYQMDSLSVTVDSISLPLVEKGYFLEIDGAKTTLQKQAFVLPRKAQKYYKRALKFNKKNNKVKAIRFYKKAIQMVPIHSGLINELAEIYWTNDAMEEVVYWTKKGIESNPIDFEAHSRLALVYQKTGKGEKALEHIILAHLYNRNHKEIIENLKSIFDNNGMNYQDFVFAPQYKIEIQNNNKVSIQANEAPWKTYAACKAVWSNDEKYKENMSHFANSATSKIEQKECLLNALIGYEKMEEGKEGFPYFGILGNALSNRMVDDFILYEIELRQNPKMIYMMTGENRQRIIRYLTTVRVNKEANPQ